MTTQLVTARLEDLVFINEGLEPESVILMLSESDMHTNNIARTLRQVAPYIAAVHISEDTFQKYLFMEESEKEFIVNSLVQFNSMVEGDGRKIGVIVDMVHRLPEWSVAEERVDEMLTKYKQAFPNVEFWVSNLAQGFLYDGSFNDVTFSYIWHTFSDRVNVKMFVDIELLDDKTKSFKIAARHDDIAAVTCYKESYNSIADGTGISVLYYGATLDQLYRTDRKVMAQRSKTSKQVNEAMSIF